MGTYLSWWAPSALRGGRGSGSSTWAWQPQGLQTQKQTCTSCWLIGLILGWLLGWGREGFLCFLFLFVGFGSRSGKGMESVWIIWILTLYVSILYTRTCSSWLNAQNVLGPKLPHIVEDKQASYREKPTPAHHLQSTNGFQYPSLNSSPGGSRIY